MSAQKYPRAEQPKADDLLSEFSLSVQSRQGKDGVEWRGVYRFKQGDKDITKTMPWSPRVSFNIGWAVFRNQFNDAVGNHSGRPR